MAAVTTVFIVSLGLGWHHRRDWRLSCGRLGDGAAVGVVPDGQLCLHLGQDIHHEESQEEEEADPETSWVRVVRQHGWSLLAVRYNCDL